MKIIKQPAEDKWRKLTLRPESDAVSVRKTVKKILKAVSIDGDRALRRFSKEFDGMDLKDFTAGIDEIEKSAALIPPELRSAILQAKQNIEAFHASQRQQVQKMETMPGVVCWRKPTGINTVGLYIPGGTAPLFSTVLMLGVPALLAGCNDVILCTPPDKTGNIHAAILYAASICGIRKIFKVGGAQAIAAMAYGTSTIPKVSKIFGPGNQFVTMAKQIVQQSGVAIDMPAGPSELLVIADSGANPSFVAADLLSQAEHGCDSQVILVTTAESFAEKVLVEMDRQIEKLPRKNIALKALKQSKIIVLNGIQKAIAFSNLYAPEHLIINARNAEAVAEQVTCAGSVFIGAYSPESAGDYASGTNHTLPTNGYAAAYSGVSVDSFVKHITYQQLSSEGLKNISATVMTMASAEGLEAHKNAVEIRLNEIKQSENV